MTEPDLRQELLAAFEGEYREHLGAIRAVLEAGPVSGAGLRDVFRRAHSLKGAARAVELPGIERIAHELETLLFASVEAARALPPEHVAAVRRGLDSIESGMRGEPPVASTAPTAGRVDGHPVAQFGAQPGAQFGARGDAQGDAKADAQSDAHGDARGDAKGEAQADTQAGASSDAQAGAPAGAPADGGTVRAPAAPLPDAASRVSAQEIDRLVDGVQAASDAMLGQEHGRHWLAEHVSGLRHLASLCEGTGDADRHALSRAARTLLRSATARLREGRHEDWQREQTVSALRTQVERVALVSAESVFGPLAAMARALGREQGQEIEVRLDGMQLLADRPVLQALRDPVIQLLRNAVGHGLGPLGPDADTPGRRRPTLGLAASIRAGRLSVEVIDNGNGPNLAAIEARARQQGLLPPASPPPDELALLALAFEPGFSTATEVDRLSGRGMGLSIVAEAAARLGGAATMRTLRDPGGAVRGTMLHMSVPLAARRQALLLVEAGGHLLALPCEAVRRLRTLPWSAIERAENGLAARIAPDRTLPVRPLSDLLGVAAELGESGRAQLVVLGGAGGTTETGLLVDRLREVSSLVVRAPAIVGIDRRLVGGVALLQDNRPVLVLEPDALRDRVPGAAMREAPGAPGAPAGTRALPKRSGRRRPTILVVDDSITTRTLEKTILQAQGYSVLIAVDGLAALDVLRGPDREIDVVVADVEMPRLDGFGLVAAMRADPRLKAMPLVLMTSRNSEADVRRGLDLGASAYLTKQEFEQGALLSVIGQLLP